LVPSPRELFRWDDKAVFKIRKEIAKEAKENPELLKKAPHTTKFSRLDEAKAARNPILRWQEE